MIKEKRKEKRLTQSELAEKIGKSAGYVNKLENRKYTNVTIQIILKLSKELEICPVEIFLFFSNIDCKYKNKHCNNFNCLRQ